MTSADISNILETLAQEDNLRRLRVSVPEGKYIETGGRRYLNLSSNDYLGLAADTVLQREFLGSLLSEERFVMGSPASRLMTGNVPEYEELEAALAALWPERAALVLGSGYAVNGAILPAVTGKEDVVLADKYVHASIIDGLRLCGCRWERYRHNDTEHLETLVRRLREGGHTADIWVATESVFSMDGDRAPLHELADLKNRYGIRIYLDEAHAFGAMGPGGRGLAVEQGTAGGTDIIVATLGKAFASVGGFVICSGEMRELLVNRMRTLIFSTALPPVNLRWSKFLLDRLPDFDGRRERLAELVNALTPDNPEATHIVPLMTYGNSEATVLAERLRESGYWVTPIKHPTVPRGKARVRVSLSAALSKDDIIRFKEVCDSILCEGAAVEN